MKRKSLPKSERLTKRREFITVSRKPDGRVETKNFLVLIKSNRLSRSRLGITVTKKIGRAVIRNKIKRHVREFYRKNKHMLHMGYDMVVIARNGAAQLNQKMVDQQLQSLVQLPNHTK